MPNASVHGVQPYPISMPVPHPHWAAHVSVMCPQYGCTPVYIAAYFGKLKCLQALVAAKADLNIANKVSGRG